MKTLITLYLMLILFPGMLSAQEKSLPKFSGLMFGDYFYNIDQRDSSKKDLNGFQFRRIYFTADYTISESFESRFRLEADQSPASLTSGGRIGVMVKDAYLKWKNIFSNSDFLFGLSPTPTTDVIESAWGYRSLEKTMLDFFGFVPTRDLGVDLKGKFNDPGTVQYWVKIGNNSANAPEVNKYKRFYGLLQFIPLKYFQFALYGDYQSSPMKTDPFDKQAKDNGAFDSGVMLNFFAKDIYSVGFEYVYKTQMNNFAPNIQSPLQSQNGYGISVWAWAALNNKIRIVGRFDLFDPNSDKGNDRLNLIVGGLDFMVEKSVSIIPNVEAVTYQGTDKKDLTGRVTFSFQL